MGKNIAYLPVAYDSYGNIPISNPIIVDAKGNSSESWDFLDWWKEKVIPIVSHIVQADYVGALAGVLSGAMYGATAGTFVAPGPGTLSAGLTGAVIGGAQGAVFSSFVDGILILAW